MKNGQIKIVIKDLDEQTIKKFQFEELLSYATSAEHVVEPTHKKSPVHPIPKKSMDPIPDPEYPFDEAEFLNSDGNTEKIVAERVAENIQLTRLENRIESVNKKIDRMTATQQTVMTIKLDEQTQSFITSQMETLKDLIVGVRQIALLMNTKEIETPTIKMETTPAEESE
jgi:hypothetical protein